MKLNKILLGLLLLSGLPAWAADPYPFQDVDSFYCYDDASKATGISISIDRKDSIVFIVEVKAVGAKMLSSDDSRESFIFFHKEIRDPNGFEFLRGKSVADPKGKYTDFYDFSSLRATFKKDGSEVDSIVVSKYDGSTKTFADCGYLEM